MFKGVIYGATAAAIWGGMYVVSDVVLEVIPPFTLLFLRLLLGALSLSVFIIGKPIPLLSGQLLRLGLITGIIGYGVSLGAQFIGTALSTAINGAVVTSATPAFVVFFAILILHEKLTLRRALSVILATVGVLVIVDFTRADFSSDTFVGNLYLALAGVTWGLYSVLVRYTNRQFEELNPVMITLLAFAGGFILVIPATAWELSRVGIQVSDFTPAIIAGILFLGVISSAVAFWLWNTAFTLLDASTASVLFFVQPVSGAILGWLFLGQAMTLTTWVGGALIAMGVVLSILAERRVQRLETQAT